MQGIEAYRDEFPITERRNYLISASLGPLSRRAHDAALEHLELWSRLGPEELWFDHGMRKLELCRERFAALIGADADEIAIVPSVSNGLASIASCLDYSERPKVVATAMDFPTNHYVWKAHAPRGVELDVVPTPDGIRIEPSDVVARIDERTAIVNVNRVLFESSWIMDLPPIIQAAHGNGAYVMVDDFHGTGVLPLDVHDLGADFLLSGALKWLCGGQGIAFLYCRSDLLPKMHPMIVGWFGTKEPFDFDRSKLDLRDDARRFETGTSALPQAWTAAEGMGILLEAGVENVRARNQALTHRIVERANERGMELLSPEDDSQRGGLVRIRVPGGRAKAEEVLHELFARDVVLDQRHDALRISPHFFNNENDIDECFETLDVVLKA